MTQNASDIPDNAADIADEVPCAFGCADIDTHRTLCGKPGEFLMD